MEMQRLCASAYSRTGEERVRAEREMIKRENKPFDVEINKAEFVKNRDRERDAKTRPPYACARAECLGRKTPRAKINEMRSTPASERDLH